MANDNVGIIIQARMGSRRLPGKIMMPLGGKELLRHIIERLGDLKHKSTVVIATSTLLQDDIVEHFCRENGVVCFRGSEENVLERYVECAKAYGFSQIVRMTGDNPFSDVEELDRLIEQHIRKGNDYSENLSVLPVGVGVEMMTYDALDESLARSWLPKHFEHVDEYILDNLGKYKHETVNAPRLKNYPAVRLTVDTLEDYKKACFIFDRAESQYVTTEIAVELEAEYRLFMMKGSK